MAVNNETNNTGGTSSTARRLFFGANVAVVVLLATIVLVGVNFMGQGLKARKDLAAGFSSHRLSERTKSILDQTDGKLTITTVYTSDEPESDRKTYLPRLQDYLEEMSQYKSSIGVANLYSGNQRAELRNRVQGKFGTAAEKYKEALDNAERTWNGLQTVLQNFQAQAKAQLGGNSWLSGFTALANFENVARKDLEDIGETRNSIKSLVSGEEGIPRYQEANNKIKTANDTLKQHLEAVQTWMKDTDKLVSVLSQTNSEFAKQSQENLKVMEGLMMNLRKAIGNPDDREVAASPLDIMKEYSKAANKLSRMLFDEHTRISGFIKDNPGLAQHPQWSVQVQVAIFQQTLPAHELLQQASQQLGQHVQVLKQIVDDPSKVSELDQKNVVLQLRQGSAQIERMVAEFSLRLASVLADAGKIDDASKEFLAKGVSGELFAAPVPATQPSDKPANKSIIEQLADVSTKINELPKLELDEIAEKMKEDNLVVIETDKSVRVVPFDEVWPAASPDAGAMGEDKSKLHRVFDGDRAISNSINGLFATKKVATVILTGYEPEPPPQMRQMQQRPTTGPIPLNQLSVVKDRLEKANFAVKEWNLAGGEGAQKTPPAPEEGTEAIYLFVPPAETPQNPMMQQAGPSFGPEQLEQVKKVLADKGKAIFLAISEAGPQRPWGPPPTYAFADMLRDDWGVDVKFNYRVIRGVRETQRPDHFNLDIMQWSFMPLSTFTDHPIGAPLKARRVLMTAVCPVTETDKRPDSVKVTPVLDVPKSQGDIWAESDVGRIITALQNGDRDSSFTKSPTAMEGFPVIVASENAKTGTKVVVMGNGISFIDPYVSRPVPRLETRKAVTLATDPAPSENIDLMLNTMYWLADQPKMIAAGPAPIPLVGPIGDGSQRSVFLVSFGWACVLLVMGGVVMFVRRK